jgi:hypothetical protein
VLPVQSLIRSVGGFQRRRDLLARGYRDSHIRAALVNRLIFRVRHGWYSVPDAPDAAIRAVRIGGRLTGFAALQSYNLRVPRRAALDVVVPRGACRLRCPTNRAVRLAREDPAIIHWTDAPRHSMSATSWRVSIDEALLFVLMTEPRDVAVATASAVARYKKWPKKRMDAVFARAPKRAQVWRELVCALDDSHGETFVRLWLMDAGVPWESQPFVEGAGWLDGRVSPNTYVEVDGGQHDPEWTGDSPSTFKPDHDRDTTVVIDGGTVLRYIYWQLYNDWPRCLAAIKQSQADDLELIARRRRNPSLPRSLRRKRRTTEPDWPLNQVPRPF